MHRTIFFPQVPTIIIIIAYEVKQVDDDRRLLDRPTNVQWTHQAPVQSGYNNKSDAGLYALLITRFRTDICIRRQQDSESALGRHSPASSRSASTHIMNRRSHLRRLQKIFSIIYTSMYIILSNVDDNNHQTRGRIIV